jgi:glucose/arabinose dehydrogenase
MVESMCPRPVKWALILVAGATVSIGCTSDTPGQVDGLDQLEPSAAPVPTAGSLSDPPARRPTTGREFARVKLRLARVAKIPDAVAVATRSGDDTLYVGTRVGRVVAVREGGVQKKPLLDISERVSTEGEQGLFSLAFSPEDDRLYISYTDRDSQGWVQSFAHERRAIDVRSRENVLRVDQPSIRHNGGNLVFDSKGHLWLGLGDGSLGNDPEDNAQTLSNLHGKLLRIQPTPDGARPYVVPKSNPFVNRPDARPEIYAYGLRNPWRFSIDLITEDLWIGDVGQYIVEEIDYLRREERAGANFGWNRLEGSLPFSGSAPRNSVDPIAEYNHDDGRCAIIGGHVYRGRAIPGLYGAYLYGDLCDGKVRGLVQKRGQVAYERDELGLQIPDLVSFAQLPDGEMFVLSLTEGVFRIEPASR